MVSPKAYELPGPDKIAQTNHADLVVIPETVQNPAEDSEAPLIIIIWSTVQNSWGILNAPLGHKYHQNHWLTQLELGHMLRMKPIAYLQQKWLWLHRPWTYYWSIVRGLRRPCRGTAVRESSTPDHDYFAYADSSVSTQDWSVHGYSVSRNVDQIKCLKLRRIRTHTNNKILFLLKIQFGFI